ncbi:heptaprenyl diphosphate synthase component 1 [Bacillus sp. P14.5]|uniref:heptaprenyl diphosphate synthase component 1 n=1 Tax=Bacillus sp. P14.5 TaxID=1983400 RepID=UPI000DEB225C|nr:heptaprenyl diphosphate synthase component 1 [Bacillus sp. P14.5]
MKRLDCFHLEASIKHYVEEKLSYSYLQKYIDSPQIDEDRISFLLVPFLQGGHELDENEIIRVISTVMLIQIGLDTHEKVSNSPTGSLKERQLTVLAGVYFSGQYYKILSDLENVSLINQLAQAIKRVNESKISLYKQEYSSIHDIMESIRTIESAVITSFYGHYGAAQCMELVSEILFLRRMLNEKNKLNQGIVTPVFPSVKAALLPQDILPSAGGRGNQLLEEIFTTYISESRDRAAKLLRNGSFVGLGVENRIHSLLKQTRLHTKIFAEEG